MPVETGNGMLADLRQDVVVDPDCSDAVNHADSNARLHPGNHICARYDVAQIGSPAELDTETRGGFHHIPGDGRVCLGVNPDSAFVVGILIGDVELQIADQIAGADAQAAAFRALLRSW